MTLVKHNNRNHAVNNWMDELFQFPTVFGKNFQHEAQSSAPAVNVLEKEDEYQLELAAPGYEKADFNVQLEGDLLTISAEKKTEEKKENEKFIRREFNRSAFKRSFSLDEKIDASAIQARYDNGILRLVLPKKAEVKATTKAIEIQ